MQTTLETKLQEVILKQLPRSINDEDLEMITLLTRLLELLKAGDAGNNIKNKRSN